MYNYTALFHLDVNIPYAQTHWWFSLSVLVKRAQNTLLNENVLILAECWLCHWIVFYQCLVSTGDKSLSEPKMTPSPIHECQMAEISWFILLRPLASDIICLHSPRSTLARIMACCLMVPSHSLSHYWRSPWGCVALGCAMKLISLGNTFCYSVNHHRKWYHQHTS